MRCTLLYRLRILLDFRLCSCDDTEDVGWNVKVARLRLLGDYHHSTRIAFVEFVMVSLLLGH